MNCEEVQTQLLEYIDKSLDTISVKHLELHLSSCPLCRAEADSLADCIHQVAALPLVDPPLGFAQRVMAHVREIEHKPSLWQRLFLPLRNKIPIQATAVVLIGALSVYLYQKEQPHNALETSEPSAKAPQSVLLDQPSELKPKTQFDKSTPPAVETVKPAPRAAQPKPSPSAPAAIASSDPTIRAAPNAETEKRSVAQREAPKRPPIQAQEVATGREFARPGGEPFGLSGIPFPAPRQSALRPALSPTEEPPFAMKEPSTDVAFVVRRRPPQRRDLAGTESSESLRKRSEADAASQAGAVRRPAPPPADALSGTVIEIRWFSVAPEHYEQFKKELAAEAAIESETVTDKREKESAPKPDRPLTVKVTILPASER